MHISSQDQAFYKAIIERDAAQDGALYYGVITTGVYCKPSCPARAPKIENVRFFKAAAEAERAGFRACKRCEPNSGGASAIVTRVVSACQLIASAPEPPKLAQLAQAFSLSQAHFQRQFKAVTGLSPKAFGDALRAQRLRSALANQQSITQALYDAGFNSSSRYYAAAKDLLGMTASAFRAGAKGEQIRFAIAQCPLGALLVAASARGLCWIALGDDPAALLTQFQERYPQAALTANDPEFDAWIAQIIGHIEEPAEALALPLDIRGTAFQQRVWAALQAIGPGETWTYSALAQKIGAPKAVRAAASACAANPLAIAIPCHRIVRRSGGMGGYRWGLARKKALLTREAETHR
jgi:AraC family transcriptional regulator of adaptative response/methylated-DNA-[protein]-cysteine methyltransferase